jgi:1-aminocyclopropane-1-carboxylate deaminase/D-cysteine desulfhydrase-like pyridoxal-dependent ACC family enzyme
VTEATTTQAAAEWFPIDKMIPWGQNPRVHDIEETARKILRFGYGAPTLGRAENREVIAGHGRLKALALIRSWHGQGKIRFPGDPPKEGAHEVTNAAEPDVRNIVLRGLVPVRFMPLSENEAHALALADNHIGEWDDKTLPLALRELKAQGVELGGLGWSEQELAKFLDPGWESRRDGPSIMDRFLVPPFTVLDTRQGYWRERKAAWISLGIKSELGRLTLGPRAQPGENGEWAYKAGTKPKHLALRTLGKDGSEHFDRKAAGDQALHRTAASNQQVVGHIFASDSGRDPDYYSKKRAVEARLGREITTEEFQAKYYVNEQTGSGLAASGTSVFDPVLCELVYRWFCPKGGRILDPFAGGSVRGVVAGKLGRGYVGIDLSAEQIAANEEQATAILTASPAQASASPAEPVVHRDLKPENILVLPDRIDAPAMTEDPRALTPVQQLGSIWLKRDDAYHALGVRGGKVRCAAWALEQPRAGLVTAGARTSTGGVAVAAVAKRAGIPCAFHVPEGEDTPEIQAAAALGATVVRHKAGRNSVLRARSRDDAAARGWYLVPFGMECQEMIEATGPQTANIPAEVARIVVPVGGGMSLAGILHGLREAGRSTPVLGVRVGSKETEKRLDQFAPKDWRSQVTLVDAGGEYEERAATVMLSSVRLDSLYEAKVIPFLRPGDLLWVVSIRPSEAS